jgi:hypothetical protein
LQACYKIPQNEKRKDRKKDGIKVLRGWEGKLGRCGGKIYAIVEEIEIAKD